LLVEDEDGVRELARRALTAHGYRVVEARDGMEALVRCRLHRDPVDLVLTDVVMPHLSGPELVPILRRRDPRVRAVYMNGHTESVVAVEGEAPVLSKPFTTEELLRAVRDELRDAAATG